MKRSIFYIYGILSYLIFVGVLIYFIGFMTNFFVPKSIDQGSTGNIITAGLIDVGLITLFALQHSIMARDGFKKKWTRMIPKPIERSTYVLFSSLLLLVMMIFWQPIDTLVWNISNQPLNIMLWVLNGFGWVFLLISTRLINEKHLFGLQQVKQYKKGVKLSDPKFQTPLFYKFTRHPMMLGFLIVFWITPVMSLGHLLFASLFTIYILIGIRFEEKAMLEYFGKEYRDYRKQVAMLIPGLNFIPSTGGKYRSDETVTE